MFEDEKFASVPLFFQRGLFISWASGRAHLAYEFVNEKGGAL